MTPRQSEVASLVALGWTNKQIARELGISPATVKNHVHGALTRLGLPRRAAIGRVIAL
jgi:two-component system nitrate/nitrite response regulator NarL